MSAAHLLPPLAPTLLMGHSSASGSSKLVLLPRILVVSTIPNSATSKLITKCAVVFDTTIPDMFIPGIDCSNCEGLHTYNLSQSSTGIDLMLNSTAIQVDFCILGQVQGKVLSDNVLLAQLPVSAYRLKVGAPTGN